jgi:hypothetical protein
MAAFPRRGEVWLVEFSDDPKQRPALIVSPPGHRKQTSGNIDRHHNDTFRRNDARDQRLAAETELAEFCAFGAPGADRRRKSATAAIPTTQIAATMLIKILMPVSLSPASPNNSMMPRNI